MSTLQHTSQLRERATRRLVLIVLIATLVAGGIAAGIVAIASGGSSPAVDTSGVVKAEPIYANGALQRELPAAKAAQASQAAKSAQSNIVPAPQTPGQRP